jgi:hypothetical protein
VSEERGEGVEHRARTAMPLSPSTYPYSPPSHSVGDIYVADDPEGGVGWKALHPHPPPPPSIAPYMMYYMTCTCVYQRIPNVGNGISNTWQWILKVRKHFLIVHPVVTRRYAGAALGKTSTLMYVDHIR